MVKVQIKKIYSQAGETNTTQISEFCDLQQLEATVAMLEQYCFSYGIVTLASAKLAVEFDGNILRNEAILGDIVNYHGIAITNIKFVDEVLDE